MIFFFQRKKQDAYVEKMHDQKLKERFVMLRAFVSVYGYIRKFTFCCMK